MENRKLLRSGLRRLAILFIFSLVVIWAGSEIVFLAQKDSSDRAPKTVQLVIPPGTAARVAAGDLVPSIPEEMTFVLGDTLVVKNEDAVDHQLGPLWIPPDSSASLVMEVPERLAYSCSFKPSQYLGLNVREPTTWTTRLIALGLAVPATTAIIFVYSLVIRPLEVQKSKTTSETLNQTDKIIER